MMEGISGYGPREWSEGMRRGEAYLRAWRGECGPTENEQLAEAIALARAQAVGGDPRHPVTLVMESLFDLLPLENARGTVATTPPIQRVRMLPEKTEFPLHDGLRRLFRPRLLRFAGAN
jgi:hypothetical protein